jgi:radical SAM superfamily enzyme YgiQ (UPF0313 family)
MATLARVKALIPNITIALGGPEFLGNNEDFLRKNSFVDILFRGEGERSFPKWLTSFHSPDEWHKIEGVCYIDSLGNFVDNGISRVTDFDHLNYPESSPYFKWDRPFVQLETTRGCFNTCAFCVSGGEKPVRFQSIEEIEKRLCNICNHGIVDIRMLDRTFNYNSERAIAILNLFERFYGKLHFHLEVHPALLSAPLKDRIAQLPKGLLHVEAGIQSLNDKVLVASKRNGSLKHSLEGLKFLASLDNVITHADLIAGLPHYTLEMIYQDVKSLAEIGVEEIQLESLKLLPGTDMREHAAELSIKYSPLPPYEVLATEWISSMELQEAMQLSRFIDFYYNCDAYRQLIREIICREDGFMKSYVAYLVEKSVIDTPLSMERKGILLFEYCKRHLPNYLDNISMAWIEAGMSLKKAPAEQVIKRKSIDATIETIYGDINSDLRLYQISLNGGGCVIYGFDANTHSPHPSFKGFLRP